VDQAIVTKNSWMPPNKKKAMMSSTKRKTKSAVMDASRYIKSCWTSFELRIKTWKQNVKWV